MVWDGGHVITTLVKHVDPDHDNPSRWGFRTAERVKEARQTNLSEVLRTLQPRTSCWGRIRLISKIILVVDGDGNSLLICLLRSISKFNASHHWLFYHPWHIGFDSVLVPTFSHSIQQWMSAVSAFYLYISTCKLFPAEYISYGDIEVIFIRALITAIILKTLFIWVIHQIRSGNVSHMVSNINVIASKPMQLAS